MSTADVTQRLDEAEHRIATWDFPGARALVQAVLDEPGLADDDRLAARRLLAEVLRELGELDAAYDLADAVAAQAERRYGPAGPQTVRAVAVLAAVRHDYDEFDEAERLYHRVLDSGVDEEAPGPLARAVRLARVNLALLQRDRGETALALSMLGAAYAVHRREYGADDLDTIRIAAELAALQHAQGDVASARRLFTVAHAAARARLGTRHPFTRAVEWELAAVEPPMPAAPVSSVPAAKPPPGEPPPAGAGPAEPPGAEAGFAEESGAQPRSGEPSGPPRPARPVWPLVSVVVVVALGAVLAGLLLYARTHPAASALPSVAISSLSVSTAVTIPSTPASTSAPPPSTPTDVTVRDLRLRDDRTELTVTWAALPVTVVVALSRAGAPAVVLARVPPGAGRYVVHGIDPGVQYCVVVGPLDERFAVTPATSACTARR